LKDESRTGSHIKLRWAIGRFQAAVILACLFMASSFLTAAEIDNQLPVSRLFGTFSPKLGVWSEYAIFNKSSGRRTVIRMSIVGVEADAFYYEVENREGEGSNVVKMLVKGDPIDPNNILQFIRKSGANPAQEIPRDFFHKDSRAVGNIFEHLSAIPTNSATILRNIKTGAGSATVPAGTFDVSLHKIVDQKGRVYAEYKYSEDVHPFGVVKSDSENSTILLVGHGTGAKSLITEEPTLISRPGEMQEGMSGVPYGMNPLPGQRPGSSIQQIPGMGRGYEPRQ